VNGPSLLLVALLLLGCSTVTPQKYGHERYIVSRHSFVSPVHAREKCIRVANRRCDERGRVMVPVDASTRRAKTVTSGTWVVLVFDCEVPKWRR